MKKFAIVFLVFLLIVFSANAEMQKRRNAFEFSDLFLKRWNILNDEFGASVSNDIAVARYASADYMNSYAGKDEYYVDIPAGTLLISVPTFEIVSYETTVIDFLNDDPEKEARYLYRAAMAYGALEYDGNEEFGYSIMSELNHNGEGSFASKVFFEFSDIIIETLENKEKAAALFKENGSKVHLYSGKYEYSLQYFCGTLTGSEEEFLVLIAEGK